MKSKGVTLVVSFILFLFTALVLGGICFLYTKNVFTTFDKIVTLSVGILSFLISCIALVISLVTYVSIDAVNNLSSMEGNVLCNENYNAEYLRLVDDYADCETQKELERKLYKKLKHSLNWKSKTCMQFTDCLQEIIDHLLWYAYVDNNSCRYRMHINRMMKSIDKRFKRFSSISNGNQYVLKEHIKLIKNVLKYQENRSSSKRRTDSEHASKEHDLLNIRGNLFTNAVSKTIYYDYLGLEYRYRAIQILKANHNLNLQKDYEIFLLENLMEIEKSTYHKREEQKLRIYLNKARESFHLAANSSQNDILWNGYIFFNLARLDLLDLARTEKPNETWSEDKLNQYKANWDKSIRQAIEARFTVLSLLSPNKQDSYLRLQFYNEYYYARALHMIMRAYLFIQLDVELDTIKKKAEYLLYEIKGEADAYIAALAKENDIEEKEVEKLGVKKEDIFEIPIKYLENILSYENKVES